MHFGFALALSDIDLLNIDLLDQRYPHLGLLDTDISSTHLLISKMSSRRLQRNNLSSSKTSSRCLEDILKTSWKTKNCYPEDMLKMSSRLAIKINELLLKSQKGFKSEKY